MEATFEMTKNICQMTEVLGKWNIKTPVKRKGSTILAWRDIAHIRMLLFKTDQVSPPTKGLLSLQSHFHPGACSRTPLKSFFGHNMTTLLSDQSKITFIRALGDPRLRPQCIWVSEAGQICPNDVAMDSRDLASSELFALRANISRPTRRTISRIVRFLLCEVCRVHETRCPGIVRRLGETSQLSRLLVSRGSRLYLYLGRDRAPSRSQHATPKRVPSTRSSNYIEISYARTSSRR
jgi:hypothetical protein